MLNVRDHSRDSAGMKYVYPVVSRRAGGVSVGINLNVNNACNWACMYCQVPDLKRGGPPAVDMALLEKELRSFLNEAVSGDFMATDVPPESRRLVDVAFSGNGEPTAAPEFPSAVELAGKVLKEFGLLDSVKLRLITNGSLMHRPAVRQGVALIGAFGGEVWFKADRATEEGMALVNGVRMAPDRVRDSLLSCAGLAPTWIQSCFFAIDGQAPDEKELLAYLDLVSAVGGKIKGVHLYGLARPSMQPGAKRLSALAPESLSSLAQRIAALGVKVVLNP